MRGGGSLTDETSKRSLPSSSNLTGESCTPELQLLALGGHCIIEQGGEAPAMKLLCSSPGFLDVDGMLSLNGHLLNQRSDERLHLIIQGVLAKESHQVGGSA
jgi:hypothetical protein